MRKRLIGCGIVVLVLGLASSLYAGGIINKQNLSADYIRTLNRNAAYDSADATVYNPAGVMRMENGLYIRGDAIYLDKDYSNKLPNNFNAFGVPSPFNAGGGTLDSDEPSIIPGFFALYKQEKWAGFFAVTVPGGGGFVDFKDGNARTMVLSAAFGGLLGTGLNPAAAKQQIEAESYYIGYTLGGSVNITDWVSFAAGVRYVDAYQEFKGKASGPLGSAKVKIEREDTAWNYFAGLNFAPVKDLNIGLLFMANTPLNFESDAHDTSPGAAISNGVGWQDGSREREDLPGYLALGVSYFLIPDKLRIEPNLTYYLEKQAKFEGQRFQDSMPGNSYDLGATLEYIFNPQWKASVGYLRTDIRGMSSKDLLPEAPELDANSLGLGVVWSPLERLSLTLGGVKVWYDSQETKSFSTRAPAGTELEKDVWGLSFGLQYRFF